MTTFFLNRLNKIGKNPTIVSNREDLQSDCKTVNAIVSALATVGSHSGVGSTEEFSLGHHLSHRRRSSAGNIHSYLGHSPTMSPPYGLPRPRSENNFALAAAAAAMAAMPFGVACGERREEKKPSGSTSNNNR